MALAEAVADSTVEAEVEVTTEVVMEVAAVAMVAVTEVVSFSILSSFNQQHTDLTQRIPRRRWWIWRWAGRIWWRRW